MDIGVGGTRVSEAEEVHIRRRIDGAEGTVEIEGIDGRLEIPALRENDLENIAGANVFLGAADAIEELGLGSAGAGLELCIGTPGRAPRLHIKRCERFPANGEFALDLSDVAKGAGVGGSGRLGGHVGGGDDVNLVAEMIEGENAIEEHEDTVGDVEIVFSMLANFFELANDVVGAVADGSGGERRKAFDVGGTVLMEEFLDDLEDAGGAGFDLGDAGGALGGFIACDAGIAMEGNLVTARLQAQEGANAEERVAADFFSAFDGLEEEGMGFVGSDGEESGNGREQIGRDGFGDGDESGLAGEAGEFAVVGADHRLRGFLFFERISLYRRTLDDWVMCPCMVVVQFSEG